MDGGLSPSQEEFWAELQRGMSKEFELPSRRDEDAAMITESTPAVPGHAISNNMGAAAATVRSRRTSQVNASLHCRNNITKKPVRPRKLQLGNVPTNLNSSTRSDFSQSMTDGSQIYEANNISNSNRLSSVQRKKLQLGNVPINLNRSTRSNFSQSLPDGSQIYAANNGLNTNRLSSVQPKKLQLGNVPINLNRSTRSDLSQSLADGSQIYAANNVLNTNRLSSVQPKNPVLTMSKRPWSNVDVVDLTKDEDSSTVYPRRSGVISNLPSSASSSRFPHQPLSYNSDTHLANRNQTVMGDQYSSGVHDLVSSSSLRSMSNPRKSVNTSLLSEPFLSDSKNKNKQPPGLIPNAPYGTKNFLPVKQEDVSYPSSSCLLPNSANSRDFFQAPNLPGTRQNPSSLSAVGSSNFAPPAYQQNNELRTGSLSANRFNVMNIKNEPYDNMFNYGNREHIPSNTAVRNAESLQQQIQLISRDECIKNNGLSLAESSRRQNMIPNNQPSMANRSSAYGLNLKRIKSEPYDHSSNTAVRNAESPQQQIQLISRDECIKNNGLSLAESSRRQSMIANNQPSMVNRSSAYGFNLKSIKSEPFDHSSNTAVRNAENSQQQIQLISRDGYIKNNGLSSLAESSRRQCSNHPSMADRSSAYGFNLKSIKSEPYDHMFHYENEGHMASSSTVGRTSSLPYTEGSRSQNVTLNSVPMANRSNNAYGFNVKGIKSEPYDHMFHFGNQGDMAASSTVGRTGGLPYSENSSRSQNMVFNSEPMANNLNAYGFNVNYGNQGQMSSSSEPMASHLNTYGFNLNYGNQGQMSSSEPMDSQSNAYGFNESYGNQGQMSSSSEPMASHLNTYGFNLNYGNQGQMSSSETMAIQSNAYVSYGSQGQMSSSEPMNSQSNAYAFNVNYGNQGQISSHLEARRTGLPEVGEYSRNSNMVANSMHEVIQRANNPRRNRSCLNKGKNVCDNYVDLTQDSP